MKHIACRLLASLALIALLGACTRTQSSPVKEPAVAAAQPTAPVPEASSAIVFLDEDNYEDEVDKSQVPVLLIICHKKRDVCKAERPLVEALAIELKGKVKFCSIELSIPSLLVYGMMQAAGGVVPWQSLPMFIAVKGGKKYTQYLGFMGVGELRTWLANAFNHEPVEQLPRDNGGNTARL